MLRNLFSQGNLQYFAALHYIEEKYGKGALEEIKIKKHLMAGSPHNAEDSIEFLKNRKMVENLNYTNIEIKNDYLDLVTNVVGFNGKSILNRDPELEEYIKQGKADIWDPHSYYYEGIKASSKIEYRAWQKPFIALDKILKLFNVLDYFKEKEKIEINKGAKKNEK